MADATAVRPAQAYTMVLVSDSLFTRRDFERSVRGARDLVLAGTCPWREVAERSTHWRPDIVVLDAAAAPLPQLPEVLARWRSANRAALIALLIGRDPAPIHTTGADAVLAAGAGAEAVVRAVQALASGVIVTTGVAPRRAGPRGDPEARQRLSTLTEREREILLLLVDGLSNREVGSRLYISPDTVKEHVSRILAKLEVASRIEAAVAAVRAEFEH
ncbi:LuxR C-terminal-related transcriptional regulator [Nocardia sp. NPDC003345]